ncbi:ER membrane protein complex subunit 6-like [Dillenia turbinata]|uniref:ER membrane protein complex subunit 6-like n=1 Tax=Dillenia turbinata TaxID=194707 RepID=A0AAN8ZCU2_9MAGN
MKEAKSAKSSKQSKEQTQDDHVSHLRSSKFFDPDASWDKDELGDVLHWIRQIMGIIFGVLWGAIPVVGGLWILMFLAITSGIIYYYYAMILKIDEEDFGGHKALLGEGLFTSFTLFLLSWILVYSLAHF